MPHPVLTRVLAATLALGVPPVAAAAEVEILDREGFDRPVVALRMELPDGWKVSGGVHWATVPGCPANTVELAFLATSPDGTLGFEVFPAYTWRWLDDPMMRQYTVQYDSGLGCELLPAMDAATFVRSVVIPRQRRDARDVEVITVEAMPDVAAAADAAARPYFEPAARIGGFPMELAFDAARVRIRSRRDGREVEEWIAATTQRLSVSGPSLTALMSSGFAPTWTHTLTASHVGATFAPAGELDRHAEMFRRIIASVEVDPRWEAAVERFFAEIARIQAEGAAARSRIWSETSRSISESQRRSWERRQAVQDRIADRWTDTFRGVETWVDPTTGERYETESGYDHAWRNAWDEVYLTNDPSDDPNQYQGGSWTRLEKDW